MEIFRSFYQSFTENDNYRDNSGMITVNLKSSANLVYPRELQ